MIYEPKPSHRRRVMICAGAGMRHDEIALSLGIDEATLREHFDHELSIGAAMCRSNVVQSVYKAATNTKHRSMSAARMYLSNEPPANAVPRPVADGEVIDVTPTPRVGKKEQANRDATTAVIGTEWEKLLPLRPNQ